ncbi:MAG: diguanylate cyclase [bacterium]|nr:diguanylate cyclase [bacterium]
MHQDNGNDMNEKNWTVLVDAESGLYNRLYLVHFLSEAHARAVRYGGEIACVLFRAAWWQGVETLDAPGKVPAEALRKLGKFLLLGVREGDILGRWSAVDFLLAAPSTSRAGAEVCMKNILSRLENLRFEGHPGLSVTVRAAPAGLPEDSGRIRYPEDMPLLAEARLRDRHTDTRKSDK